MYLSEVINDVHELLKCNLSEVIKDVHKLLTNIILFFQNLTLVTVKNKTKITIRKTKNNLKSVINTLITVRRYQSLLRF